MARPPRDPRDTRGITEMLRRLGINPDSVRIIVPRDGADQLGFPDNDNVIPFPKSGNAKGRRPLNPPSYLRGTVMDMIELMRRDLASGKINPMGGVCLFLENVEGSNDARMSIYHMGLTRYEKIGLLHDAAHDVMCGSDEEPHPDDGDAA